VSGRQWPNRKGEKGLIGDERVFFRIGDNPMINKEIERVPLPI
jgi:hypothetical protein